MGFKQGSAMLQENLKCWNYLKNGILENPVMVNGLVTMLSAVLILFPKTLYEEIF